MMHFYPIEKPMCARCQSEYAVEPGKLCLNCRADMDAINNDPEWHYGDDGPTYDGPPDDEEGNRIAYDMLYDDEPDFDPDDTQEHIYPFDESEDDDE